MAHLLQIRLCLRFPADHKSLGMMMVGKMRGHETPKYLQKLDQLYPNHTQANQEQQHQCKINKQSSVHWEEEDLLYRR